MKTLPVTVLPVRYAISPLPFPVLASTAACGFPSPAEDFFREEDRLDLNAKLAFHQDAYRARHHSTSKALQPFHPLGPTRKLPVSHLRRQPHADHPHPRELPHP